MQQQLDRFCNLDLGRDDVHAAHLALRDAGATAESPLLSALADGARPAEARSRIAGVLADLQSAKAIPALVTCLGDESVHLRWHAVQALGKIGDASVIPELARVAREDSGELTLQPGFTIRVRDAAQSALTRLRR